MRKMQNMQNMQNMAHFVSGGPGNVQQNNPDGQVGPDLIGFVIQSLQQQAPGVGWRAQVDYKERIHWIKQIINSLRLLPQPANDLARIANAAIHLEHKTLIEADTKEAYVRECQQKLGSMRESRAQQANAQAHSSSNQKPFHNFQQMQPMGQNSRFPPQLQHPMQASPIPQPRATPMGMNANPAMNAQNVAGSSGRGVQQQGNFVQNQQPRVNAPTVHIKMTPEDKEAINRLAHQLAHATSQEDRRKIQQSLAQTVPAEQLQQMKAKGIDILGVYFRERATKEWRHQRQSLATANPGSNPDVQMNSAMTAQGPGQTPATAPGPQAVRGATAGGRGVPAGGQPGSSGGGAVYLNNTDHFQGLQADGLRSQQQGQLVVPASNGQGINAEQFQLQQLANNQHPSKQNANGMVNQQFVPPRTQPPQMQPGHNSQQIPNNTVNLQPQAAARLRTDAGSRAPQQQHVPYNEQEFQPVSQSATPVPALTRPLGGKGQGLVPPQPQGTPQPRPQSRAPNPVAQPGPHVQRSLAQEGPQNNSRQPAPQPQTISALPQQLQAFLREHPQSQWNEIIAKYRQQQAMRQPRYPNEAAAPSMSQTLSQPGQKPQTPNKQHLGEGSKSSHPMQQSASAGAPMVQGLGQGLTSGQQAMFQPQRVQQHQAQAQAQQRRPPEANGQQPSQMSAQQAPRPLTQPGNPLGEIPDVTAYMDQQPVPPNILQTVGQGNSLPGHIKLWAHLKQYLAHHPSPHLSLDRITSVQRSHYQQWLQIMARNQSLEQQRRPNAVPPMHVPQGPPPFAPNMRDHPPAGEVAVDHPPAKMVDDQAAVAQQEMQRLLMTNPHLTGLPEHQLRAYLPVFRQNEAEKRMALSYQPPNNQQFPFMPGQTSVQPPQPGPSPQAQQPQAVAGSANNIGPAAQGRSGMSGPWPPNAVPRPAPQVATGPPPAPANQHAGRNPIRNGGIGVPEGGHQNIPKQPGPQPHATAGPRAASFPMLSEEELSRLTPEQQKTYRDRQQQFQHQRLLTHIGRLNDEVRRSAPLLHPFEMSPPNRARIVRALTAPATKLILNRFNTLVCQYLVVTKNSEAVKQLLQYKMYLLPQYVSDSIKTGTWEPADRFSISAEYAETAVNDLMARFKDILPRVGSQPVAANVPYAAGTHPLSYDNLTKHNNQDARNGKRPAQEVPPAPTSAQAPFPFSTGSPRGHGTPRYAASGAKPALKQEDLKLPPKRQKKNPEDGAGLSIAPRQASPGSSPGVAKSARADEMPFKCAVADCEFHSKGFASMDELDHHSGSVHKPAEEPIADPLVFFLESLRHGLGLDENGTPKAKARVEERQKTVANIAATTVSKSSTPVANGGATMSRDISQSSRVKDKSPKPVEPSRGSDRTGANVPTVNASTEEFAWDPSKVSLSDLHNTFGGLISDVRGSPSLHDPLAPNDDLGDFMDQFMESAAWIKVQEKTAPTDGTSSKATESPAVQSEQGKSSSDVSFKAAAADDLFIKIGAQDTELAESWALPELKIEPLGGDDAAVVDGSRKRKAEAAEAAAQDDDMDEWIKMDWGDIREDEMDIDDDFDVTAEMDFEWKEVDWDKLEPEQGQANNKNGSK